MEPICNSRFTCHQYFGTSKETLGNIASMNFFHCICPFILVYLQYVYKMIFYIEVGHFFEKNLDYTTFEAKIVTSLRIHLLGNTTLSCATKYAAIKKENNSLLRVVEDVPN